MRLLPAIFAIPIDIVLYLAFACLQVMCGVR
jgi:hypothetical protein